MITVYHNKKTVKMFAYRFFSYVSPPILLDSWATHIHLSDIQEEIYLQVMILQGLVDGVAVHRDL